MTSKASPTIEAALLRTLHRRVASNLYLEEDRPPGEYRVGACVTEILDDAKLPRRTVRYVKLDNVATYRFRMKRGRVVIQGPGRRDVATRAGTAYRRIVQKSQDLLLPSLYGRLVSIPDVRLAMSPLRVILMMLERRNEVRPEMFITPKKSAAKVQNYFTLLEDLRIIKRENHHYVQGTELRRISLDESEEAFYSRILGSVLERRFEYIREVLKWTMMVPFLEWSNAYYFPAYEARALLRWKDEDYFGCYHRLYGRPRNEAETVSQTTKVKDARVVLRDAGFWVGDDEIFEEFSKQSDRQQLLESVS